MSFNPKKKMYTLRGTKISPFQVNFESSLFSRFLPLGGSHVSVPVWRVNPLIPPPKKPKKMAKKIHSSQNLLTSPKPLLQLILHLRAVATTVCFTPGHYLHQVPGFQVPGLNHGGDSPAAGAMWAIFSYFFCFGNP